mgnify:CR=1 FL=1
MDNSFKNNNRLSVFNATTFSVILRRYSLPEVPWRRIYNVIAKVMSRFFRYPSPDTNVSTYPSGSEVSQGRSMIEMLGVLAIIAVLSVGGIAGYSKAMEKFKVNKAVSEYSYLIQGLLEHLDNIQRMSNVQEGDVHHGLVSVVQAAGLVPETWNRINYNDSMSDPYGNRIQIFSRKSRLVIDMYLGGFSALEDGGTASLAFSPKFCSTLMQDVAQPLSSVLYYVWFTNSGQAYFGDKFCGSGKKCIRDLTISEMQQACNYCTKESGKLCGLILEF